MSHYLKGKYTMFRRKLTILIVAVAIALVSAIPAFAGTSSVTDLRLAPGSSICLTPQTATSYADVQGTANGGGMNVAVYNGAVNATNTVFPALNTNGFHTTFTTSLPQGAVIPGKFKVCASNPSTTNNTRISLSLVTN
jgi:hypothetical protein